MAKKRHLLITGVPGVGKTTLLVELARRFSELVPSGFYTEEVREKGERRGFRLKSLDGRKGVLSDISIRGGRRVGRYGVDIDGFENFFSALDLPSQPSRLVFIDEIGKMECLSPQFVTMIKELLDSGKTMVATVARKGEGFMADVKRRADVELVEVTRDNRAALADRLTAWLEENVSIPEGQKVQRDR